MMKKLNTIALNVLKRKNTNKEKLLYYSGIVFTARTTSGKKKGLNVIIRSNEYRWINDGFVKMYGGYLTKKDEKPDSVNYVRKINNCWMIG